MTGFVDACRKQPQMKVCITTTIGYQRSIRVKIDQDYLKRLLEACQASMQPTFDIEELKAAGLDYSDARFDFT